MKVSIVDPPSGWQYGFPAPLKKDYEKQLREAGYPEKDLSFAMKYSRFWDQELTEEEIQHMDTHAGPKWREDLV